MITFIIGLVILFVGAAVYGAICEKVFGPDDRQTPAYSKQDGVDYVPMPKWKNMLINLLNIAGPSTMAALLNSLQMGFKTLAIQKRSSEVWDVLSSVKSEFETFGTALEQAQTRINQAGNALESLVGVRTRQIQRKLRSVTTLPEAGAAGEALEE